MKVRVSKKFSGIVGDINAFIVPLFLIIFVVSDSCVVCQLIVARCVPSIAACIAAFCYACIVLYLLLLFFLSLLLLLPLFVVFAPM